MRISFPARYCSNYRIASEKTGAIKAIKTVFENLNWNYSPISDCKFIVSIPFNFWSFGEKIEVELSGEDVIICSKCISPFQCFDWGKNKRNVDLFIKELKRTKRDLLSGRPIQTTDSFDKNGLSPVERIFAETE